MKDILNLMIIDRESGICIFEQDFEDLPSDADPELVGGFFTALMCFSNRIADQQIKFIQLEKIRFYFHTGDKLVLISATRNSVSLDYIKQFLEDIHEKFVDQFQDVISKGKINESRLFRSFAVDIETEVGRKTRFISIFNESIPFLRKKYKAIREDFTKVTKILHEQARRFKEHLIPAKNRKRDRGRITLFGSKEQGYFEDYKTN